MYGARAYLAYLRYGPCGFFKIKSYGAMATFGPGRKYIPVPYSHKYCTVPKVAREIKIRPFLGSQFLSPNNECPLKDPELKLIESPLS